MIRRTAHFLRASGNLTLRRTFATSDPPQSVTLRSLAKAWSSGLLAWSVAGGIASGNTGEIVTPTEEYVETKYSITLTSGSWQGTDSLVGLVVGNLVAFWRLGRSASLYFLAPSLAITLLQKFRGSATLNFQVFEYSIIKNRNAENYKLSELEEEAISLHYRNMIAPKLPSKSKVAIGRQALFDEQEFSAALETCQLVFDRFCEKSSADEQVLRWHRVQDEQLTLANLALVKAAFSAMDPEGKGELNFLEFASGALAACCNLGDYSDKAAQAMLHELSFRILDNDKDGIIEKQRLSCWVGTLLKNGVFKCHIDGVPATYHDLRKQGDWQSTLEKSTLNILEHLKTSQEERISLSEYLDMKRKKPWMLPVAVWLKNRVLATPGETFKLTCFSIGGQGWEYDYSRCKWIRHWYPMWKKARPEKAQPSC